MDDDWDDNPSTGASGNNVDHGHSISQGRGFTPMAEDNGWGGDGGGRGGGRGGRGGRGGGRGGRGGSRGGRDNGDDYGGGRRNYNDDKDDNWGSGGGGGGGGGRGGRGGRGGGRYNGGDDWESSNDRRGARGRRGGRRYDKDEDGGGEGRRNYGGGGENNDDDWGSGGGGGGRGGRGGRGGFDGERRGRGGGRGGRDSENGGGDWGGGGGGGGGNREGGEDGEERKPSERYVPPEPTDNEDEMFSTGISSGINFDKLDNIAVKVTGDNTCAPIDSFDSAGLRKFVLDNVKKSGYKKPTPIQKHAIPSIMSARDIMACAQTGSGKTAAFLVPIINMLLEDASDAIISGSGCAQPQCVVLSPTRELAIQIYNEARKFAHGSILKVCLAYGGTLVRHQVEQVQRGCHILVATTGRMLDFVERNRVNFESIRFVVLDEADRMLDMGFMKDVEKMMNHSTMTPPGERQTLMFSATFPEEIQHLAGKFLTNYLFIAVGIVGGASSDVEQLVMSVSKFEKKDKLVEILRENEGKRTLVFLETKRGTDFIASFICQENFKCTSIHGDRLQSQREEALRDFKSGKMTILTATAVAARGLDIKNVDLVVNYDMPKSIDEYVHRIGRTGRVGNRGRAISFFDPENDLPVAADLAKILEQAEQPVPDFLKSGGTSSYRSNAYGGKDIRDFNAASAAPAACEPEEDW